VPFLRFSKDRRGYENTFLLHSSRRRNDKDRPTLLYWFRTPPHIKVGRAAFDESAIRALEDEHPGVEFDWPRILATHPPLEGAEPEQPRRPIAKRSGTAAIPVPASAPAQAASTAEKDVGPVVPLPEQIEAPALAPSEPEALLAGSETPSEMVELPPEPLRKFVRVFDRETDPEPEPPHHLSDPSVAERILGSEQLGRLRGQYAAALARISRRITDQTLAESLRTLAERINPDAWVTEDDVRQGLQGAAGVQDELARHIGRRRRRRRRGRSGGTPVPGQVATSEPAGDLAEGGSEDEAAGEADDEDDGEVE
jgi:hypothetical protein